MSKLANKVALVTGGSRGIGAAVAKRLATDGANVAITYAKDASAASAVVRAIELGGGKVSRDPGGCRERGGSQERRRKGRGYIRQTGCACEQCRHRHAEAVRGGDAGGDGPRARHQRPRRVRHNAGCAEAHEGRWSHHHGRFSRGRARRRARTCALRGHEGGRQNVYPGAVKRHREPGHYGQQRSAGPDRHGFESRLG